MSSKIKREIMRLLKEDEEFRYMVAGLIGLEEILKRLDFIGSEQKSLRQEQKTLREDFNKMLAVLGSMNKRLSRVEETLEKLTIDIEEEARSIIEHRLAQRGLRVKISNLRLPDLEINIYGVTDNICFVGEASVRAGLGILNKLEKKLKVLRDKYPQYLRDKIILIIYSSLPLPELIAEAKKKGIWVLKATEDIVPLEQLD